MAERAHRRRLGAVLCLAVAALGLAAAAWHVAARSAYDATTGAGTPASRISSAELASRLEPWSDRFAWRALTLKAEAVLDAGNVDRAFWMLQPYSQIVRDDPVYRRVYQRAVTLKTPLDARKAHVQHAKEKAGGVLLEQDVQH